MGTNKSLNWGTSQKNSSFFSKQGSNKMGGFFGQARTGNQATGMNSFMGGPSSFANKNAGGSFFSQNSTQTSSFFNNAGANNKSSFFNNASTMGSTGFFNKNPSSNSFFQNQTSGNGFFDNKSSFFNSQPQTTSSNQYSSFFSNPNPQMHPQPHMNPGPMQPNYMGHWPSNQNLNPNLQPGLQPIVNSFISGLLMNLSNTPQRQNGQIEKGKIEILEGILETMKKEQSQESQEELILANAQKENEMMETLLRELNREAEPSRTEPGLHSQGTFHSSQDKGWIPSKVFQQRSRPRVVSKPAPLSSSKSFKQKNFSMSFRNLSKDFESERFLELDVLVNYLNHSKILERVPVNPKCKLDLLVEGVLKKVDLFGQSLQKVKQSAEIFFDDEKYEMDRTVGAIEDVNSAKVCLNINVLFQKQPGADASPKEPKSELCPEVMLPICRRPNYTTTPSMTKISRMTLEQVENVEDFSIENEYGKITWPGKTNLVGINLDLLVNISSNLAEVYPDDMYPTEETKHMKGTGLNKTARITLYNIEKPVDKEDFEQYLMKLAKEQNCKHVDYDESHSKWTFEVDHFSRYLYVRDTSSFFTSENRV